MSRDSPLVRQWIPLGIALFLLNAAVTFQNVWPTLWITTRHELSIELAALLFGLVLYAELAAILRWPMPGRRLTIVLSVLLLVLCIGRYADVTAPALYGRPVNLYWDAQHLPRVAAMLAEVASPWVIAALVLGALLLVASLAALFLTAIGLVTEALRADAPRRALGALAVAIVGTFFAGRALDWPSQHFFSVPVVPTYVDQIEFIVAARAHADRELPIEPLEPSNLERVAGADVVVMFLESYGAVTYDSSEISRIVAPARAELEHAAADTGQSIASAFVRSPTFGGASWLAHATLLTGFEVRDPGSYELLLTQSRETLPALFAVAGYRSLAWMPGLRNPWPEGEFYGFGAILGESAIDYRGPAFGWWRIPDQYSLAKLDAVALSGPPGRPPVFAFFPTINTHIPFRPTPPYQPDWQRVLGAAPYDDAAIAASLGVEPDWTSLGVPYAESVAYTLEYLAGYLRERAPTDLVLILVGDHQPAASVAGRNARWDVPVHVITHRRAIVDSLRDAGFIEGAGLARAQNPVSSMRDLTTLLLRAFDSGGGTPGYGSGRDSVASH
jgi:hypothetical protein